MLQPGRSGCRLLPSHRGGMTAAWVTQGALAGGHAVPALTLLWWHKRPPKLLIRQPASSICGQLPATFQHYPFIPAVNPIN